MSGRLRVLLALCITAAPVLYGQVVNGVQCIANSGVPTTVRSEGFAELTGDIVLNCSGGTPTPLGQPIPTSDITLYYNTQVTSRLLNGNRSEALLTIDEPPASQTSAAQICTSAGGCPAIGAGPNVTANTKEFRTAFNSITGQSCTAGTTNCVLNPNVFQGTVAGNSVTFSGIPIDPPGTQSNRIYRITNIRCDATVPAPSAGGTPGQVIGLFSATPASLPGGATSTFAINNPTQIVAFIQPSLSAAVRDAANSGALTSPIPIGSPTLTKVAVLHFSELFPTALKARTISGPGAEQNTLGLVYNTESGYYNTRLGVTAGLADSGTRVKAVFKGIPAGVRLFVDIWPTPQPSVNPTNLALLTASETGPFSAVPATNGSAAEIAISGGTGTAVWEYMASSPLSIDSMEFGVYAIVSGNPASATISVNASYAPFGSQVATATAGPRFADTSTPVNIMSTGSCSLGIMTPATLSMGLVGVPYGPLALGPCGGTPPYTWSAAAGSLPPGLSLSAAGVLSGTPSAVWTTTFDVTLADNTNQRVSKTFTLRVVQPLVFPYTNLPDAKVLATYSAALSASGGVPPYAWSVVNPPLPLVLGLDSSSGVISGGAPQLPGTYTFQIRVTDSVGQSVTNSVQLTVAPSPGYVCSANSGVPPMIRSEGRAELASDIWLLCTYDALSNGPTPLGVPIPTTDIQLTFTAPTSWVDPGAVSPGSIPVPLAGRPLADSWSEALLFLDEPAKGKRFPCDTANGVCSAVGDGTGRTSYYGGGPVGTAGNNRNVFQGKIIGPNTLLFSGIPIDPPPGPNGYRVIRITNIRVNAAPATPVSSSTPGQVIATISAIGPAPIIGPQQIVAFVQQGLDVSLRDAANTGSLTPPTIEPCVNPPLTKIATLRFAELFPNAFKRRVEPYSGAVDPLDQTLLNQDTLGAVVNAETSFRDSTLSNGAATATRGNLGLAGLADFGTRYKAVFRNVPAGVRLFVDTSYASRPGNSITSDLVQLTSSETGAFSTVAATNGSAAEIAITNGTGTAIWESLAANPLISDNEDIGVYVTASGNPAPATITVNGSFGPIGTGTSVPQFADTSTPMKLLSTRACAMNVTSSTTLGVGIAGVSYAPATLTASGGTPPYNWSVPAGSLPAGFTLSDAGVLTGTPLGTGTAAFTATVADSAGRTLTQSYSLTVVAPLSVASYILPNTMSGATYGSSFAAAGGLPPYNWTVAGGSFPPGLSLNSATGALTGMAPGSGNYNFVVRVADAIGEVITFSANLTVTPPPVSVQTAPTLPAGVAGSPYSFTLSVGGGQAPFIWTLTGGSLPAGLTVGASGLISGTPSAPGTFTFSVQVRDAAGTSDRATFTLKINPAPLTITTTAPLAPAHVGSPYSQAFTAAGGVPPYTWGISGIMSPGISFNKTGVLSGTPTATGSYLFAVSLTDGVGTSLGVNFTLTVLPPAISITSSTMPAATVGSGYSAILAATGGTTPYRWSATGIPDSLVLDAGAGTLAGSVKLPGTSTINATVTDAAGLTATAALSLTANMPPAPASSFADTPSQLDPAAQPVIQFSLGAPYPFSIQGRATLVFTPDSGPDDPAVQFSSGGRTADFTIAGGQVAPAFVTPMWGLQSGTTAGKIEISVRLQSLGVAITPAPPVWNTRIGHRPPAITGVEALWTAEGLTVSITGYSTSRSLKSARFRVGDSAEVIVPLDTAFAQWLADPDAANHGGRFMVTQSFPDADPAAASAAVVLVNEDGESSAVSVAINH